MAGCGGRQKKFVNLLKVQGIDAVFRTNDQGRIYGATFIDHNAREVYNGSRIGKEFSANAFEWLFNGHYQSPFDSPHPERDRHHGQEQPSSIEAAFGIFDFPPSGLVDEPVPQVKKKKRRYIPR